MTLVRVLAGVADVLDDSWGALLGRRWRTLLSVLGVGVAVMAVVASTSLSATAGARISERFDVLLATTVTADSPLFGDGGLYDAIRATSQLNGVVAVGAVARSPESVEVSLGSWQPVDSQVPVSVIGVTAGALDVLSVSATSGRLFDEGHVRRGDKIALVGGGVAAQLGGLPVAGRQRIVLGGQVYVVAGTVTAPATLALDVTSAILVPLADKPVTRLSFGPPTLNVRTRPGAAQQVGREMPFAISATHPDQVLVQVPPQIETLREGVSSDTAALLLGVSGATGLITALGVGTTMYVSVLERRVEFGVRRSVGFRPRRILAQVLQECSLIGLAGGLLGTLLGLDVAAAVAAWNGWLLTIADWTYWGGPILGLVVSLLGGIVPAILATRATPIDAIRG